MGRLRNVDWFYFSILLLLIALPFSKGLISIAAVLMFFASLLRIRKGDFRQKLVGGKDLLFFSSTFLIPLIGLFYCRDGYWGLDDLKKFIPFLIIPLSFVFAGRFSFSAVRRLLFIFSIAVVFSALWAVLAFYFSSEQSILEAQEYGFVHHIQFSLLVIMSIFILVSSLLFYLRDKNWLSIISTMGMVVFLLLFLIWHQSFTGILSFIGTCVLGLIIFVVHEKRRLQKMLLLLSLFLVLLIPSIYFGYALNRFYCYDKVDVLSLEDETAQGNCYIHDVGNHQVENGHYVGLYWCEAEMEQVWNQRSSQKYHSVDKYGYQVKETLVRYLTSKNLRKDANGVSQLTENDVRNIEAGISNYLLAGKGLSLYPRIYVAIWEVDNYLKTGYADARSLSLRIEYIKASLLIICDHFWFGVGTGNWKEAFGKAYRQLGSKMNPQWFGHAHNQYLNYWVKYGLLGLLIILTLIIYPIVHSKAYRNPIFLLFLVNMLLANFADSILETHVGGYFFVLFYCLFLISEKGDESLSVSNHLNCSSSGPSK